VNWVLEAFGDGKKNGVIFSLKQRWVKL